jgi:hypothetical protein
MANGDKAIPGKRPAAAACRPALLCAVGDVAGGDVGPPAAPPAVPLLLVDPPNNCC